MSNQTLSVDDRILNYLLSISLREPDALKRLREVTAKDSMSKMQIAPEQGQFIALIVELLNANMAIEIGTYTGYSSLWIALALPEKGQLICCDTNDQWTAIARDFWKKAGVAEKIKLRLAPALDTLDELLSAGRRGEFDFIFIDADKPNYLNYYYRCLKLLRPGGLIAVDNTLWGGSVADEENNEVDVLAIRRFNQTVFNDKRVTLSLVPIGDGLTLARKRF